MRSRWLLREEAEGERNSGSWTPRRPVQKSRAKKPKGPPRKPADIRNLSFKCSEDDLKALFSPFGAVLEVNIPKKTDGKMRGFAFVQFKNILQAGKALKGMNMKEIKGRTVAVDWAVAKDKYRAMQAGPPSGDTEEKRSQIQQQDSGSENASEEEEEGEVLGSDELSSSPVPGRLGKGTAAARADSSEEEEEEAGEAVGEAEDGSEAEREEPEGSDESTAGSEEDNEDADVARKRKKGLKRPSDVAEGRTVFIRNVAFDTEEEELGEMLEQFGDLKYVRIVLHPDTEHSRGCAFAQFTTQEAAQKCLEAAQDDSESGGLRLGGRRLQLDLAVSRDEAQKLRAQKVKKPTGTRNLYLAREGLIRAGTQAAEGVSTSDMAKRARVSGWGHPCQWAPTAHSQGRYSRHRLCLARATWWQDGTGPHRALGWWQDGTGPHRRGLVGWAACRGGSQQILDASLLSLQCRVMRNLTAPVGKGQGQSLGYAFVEFEKHEHALAVLRHTNNNPQLFGPHKVGATHMGWLWGPWQFLGAGVLAPRELSAGGYLLRRWQLPLRRVLAASCARGVGGLGVPGRWSWQCWGQDPRLTHERWQGTLTFCFVQQKQREKQAAEGQGPPRGTGPTETPQKLPPGPKGQKNPRKRGPKGQGDATGPQRQKDPRGPRTQGPKGQKDALGPKGQGDAPSPQRQKDPRGLRAQGPKGQKDAVGPKGQGYATGAMGQQNPRKRSPEGQGAGTPWAGFQTKAEVEQVELPDGKKRRKVLMLPTHRGPKIRQRDRGKPAALKKPKAQASQRQQEKQRVAPRQAPGKRRRPVGGRAEARFDQLVEQYKRKILGSAPCAPGAKRSKWFES
nr:RNA-binding protein 28 [Chelonoidis abingdonii]